MVNTPTTPMIRGYRVLSEDEVATVNLIKDSAEQISILIERLKNKGVDQRWVSIGATDLQKGFMALTRAVTKPDTF